MFTKISAIFNKEECENCIDYFRWDNSISYTQEEETTRAVWNKIIHGESEAEKKLKSAVFNLYNLKRASRIFDWIKMIAVPARSKIEKKKYQCPKHMCKLDKEFTEDTMFIFFSKAILHFKSTPVFVEAGDVVVFDESRAVSIEALDNPVYFICMFMIYKSYGN